MIIEEENGLTLEINENNGTAKVINSPKCRGHVLIPRSIMHNSQEYIITTIAESFGENSEIKMVDFPQNSEVETIEDHAYCHCSEFTLYLPSKIKDFKYNWFSSKFNLEDVSISPDNKNFKILDNLLLGKSDITSDCFDIIFLSGSNIEYVIIPPYIKKISPYAFYNCRNLNYVKFSENSELEFIGESAFSNTRISKITIPKSVKIIEKNAFRYCEKLIKIEFEENSEINSISQKNFYYTQIKCFCIPDKVERLEDGWLICAKGLSRILVSPKNKNFREIENKMIVGKSNLESETFDTLFFVPSNDENIVIPSYIKHISSDAFAYKKYKSVKFADNSQLETIDQYAFFQSTIDGQIIIPKSVKIIGKFAFSECGMIKKVEFEENSKLEIIGEKAFKKSQIMQISIPKSVRKICKGAFKKCNNLENVSFQKDNELRFIGKGAFKRTAICDFEIPKNVAVIREETFMKCKNLIKVTTEEGSKLTKIEKGAFFESNIKRLELPTNLNKLKSGWCECADSLTEVIIPSDNRHFKVLPNKMIVGESNINYEKGEEEEEEKDDIEIADDDDDDDEEEEVEEHHEQEQDKEGESRESSYDAIYFAPRDIEEIKIATNIKSIKPYAFSGCSKLQEIDLHMNEELSELCAESFSRTPLRSIFIPKHVTRIGSSCFYFCKKLTDVKFSEESELQIIGDHAFSCTQITDVIIPRSVTKIKSGAFSCCDFLKTFQFSREINLKIISKALFYHTSLKSISIPKSVQVIQKEAFERCEELSSIDIPEDSELNTIEDKAFDGCNIVAFNVPSQLKVCDFRFAFAVEKIEKITVSPNNKHFSDVDNKMVLSKSDINSEIFDVLCFAVNDVNDANIPSHVKRIKTNAFSNCTITKLVLPEDLEIIDEFAFTSAELPDRIVIPKHVKRIGENAFMYSTVKSIEFEENSELQIIENCAFKKSSLCQISMPSNVEYIGMSAFEDSSIESIFIPKHVKIIRYNTFNCCEKLKKVEFAPDSQLEIISKYSFYNCPFETIAMPDHVQEIRSEAFFDCNFLESVLITEKSEIQKISDMTFSRISSLCIPPKLKELEKKWCLDLSFLTNVSISPSNEYFALIDGKYFVSKSQKENKEYDILHCVLGSDNKIIIPSCIKKIAQCAFAYKSDLKSVEISADSELEIIDDYAFYQSQITSIFIPKHVKVIGDHAFGSTPIETVEFAENSELHTIKANAFDDCRIHEICLPQHVQFIDGQAFRNTQIECFVFPKDTKYENCYSILMNCENLKEIVFSDDAEFIGPLCHTVNDDEDEFYVEKINIPQQIDDLGCILSMNGLIEISVSPNNRHFKDIDKKMILMKSDVNSDQFDTLCYCVHDIKNVIIPSCVRSIEKKTFSRCYSIEKVEFQENSELEIIGNLAFSSSSIQSIKIPKHVKKICEAAFWHCENLQSLEFEENSELEFIETFAFYGSTITEAFIPSRVKIIGHSAFSCCYNLSKVEFEKNSKLEIIGNQAFENTAIEQFIIPKTVRKIGKGAFKGTAICDFEIPKNVAAIREETFMECKNLIKVTTEEGSKLTKIEKGAFFESNIKRLELSTNLNKLNSGWCECADSLTEVIIPSDNRHFKVLPNKMIVGESNINYEKEEEEEEEEVEEHHEHEQEKEGESRESSYDAIYFAPRDIEEIKIATNIKSIKPYAFSGCSKLQEIDLHMNEELSELCSDSFSRTPLRSIFIPKHVTRIGSSCFASCNNLFNIEFDNDSKAVIENDAIICTPIRGLIIPRGIDISSSVFIDNCPNIYSIEFLNDDISATNLSFQFITSVSVVSFPNAHKVVIEINAYDLEDKEEDLIVFVAHHASINLHEKY